MRSVVFKDIRDGGTVRSKWRKSVQIEVQAIDRGELTIGRHGKSENFGSAPQAAEQRVTKPLWPAEDAPRAPRFATTSRGARDLEAAAWPEAAPRPPSTSAWPLIEAQLLDGRRPDQSSTCLQEQIGPYRRAVARVAKVKDLSALEKQFIKVAQAYGERKGILLRHLAGRRRQRPRAAIGGVLPSPAARTPAPADSGAQARVVKNGTSPRAFAPPGVADFSHFHAALRCGHIPDLRGRPYASQDNRSTGFGAGSLEPTGGRRSPLARLRQGKRLRPQERPQEHDPVLRAQERMRRTLWVRHPIRSHIARSRSRCPRCRRPSRSDCRCSAALITVAILAQGAEGLLGVARIAPREVIDRDHRFLADCGQPASAPRPVDVTRNRAGSQREAQPAVLLGNSAPGSNPASVRIWKPLQMPTTGPAGAGEAE